MIDVMAKTPFSGQGLPLRIGHFEIAERSLDHVWSVMPFMGKHAEAAKRLQVPLEIGSAVRAQDREVIWTGQNQWFCVGAQALPDLDGLGAVTDQSDGWAALTLDGTGAGDVMARLCPLDLRGFSPGQAARSEFAHMMAIILPRDTGYEIWVMRSCAHTALHHLKTAASSIISQR